MSRLVVVLLAMLAGAARADDDYSLDQDLPLRLDDAAPTDAGRVAVQLATLWEHTHEHEDRVNVEPRLKWGVLPDLDLQLQTPLLAGDADDTGSRTLQVRSQWRFLREGPVRPAAAVQLELDTPTGVRTAGLDTQVEAIASKTLTRPPAQDRLHADATWIHDAAPRAEERADRWSFVLGWSRRLRPGTILVADAFHEQQRERGMVTNQVEVGVVQSVGERVKLAAGVGTGIGRESPHATATLAIEVGLTER